MCKRAKGRYISIESHLFSYVLIEKRQILMYGTEARRHICIKSLNEEVIVKLYLAATKIRNRVRELNEEIKIEEI